MGESNQVAGRALESAPVAEETVRYELPESAIPTAWVNLMPDLPGEPLPPLSPATGQPAAVTDARPYPLIRLRARNGRKYDRARGSVGHRRGESGDEAQAGA